MSLKSMIAAARTRCDVYRKDETMGDGSQLQVTLTRIYERVPIRLVAREAEEKSVEYDRAQVNRDYTGYIEYHCLLNEKCRIKVGSRVFDVKKVDDWDEQNRFQRLSLTEITDA